MAQIVTITNPLTGQPAQVDQLEHTAQEIDDGISRALPGGTIDTLLDGKAPAGYGLGEKQGKRLLATDDLNSITTPGWYWWSEMPSNAPTSNACMLVYSAYNGECYVQEIHKYLPSGYTWNDGGTIIIRQIYTTYIGEWEYVNPPMSLGEEYRTTERYQMKPVYVKLVNFGKYPASGTKTVAHKISNVENIVSCLGTSSLGYSVNGYSYVSAFYADKTNINITVTADVSNNEVKVMLKYTKTTD